VQLYRPAEHEPLVDDAWAEGRARETIAEIVTDAEQACDGLFWPDHPNDEWPAFPPGPTTIYLGSAGMCLALHRLGSSLDVGAVVERALGQYRAHPDFSPEFGDEPSLVMGESGLLLVARIVGSRAADDERLAARIHENRANPTWEWMWGSPGTMLAARECGLNDLWRESAELLWAAWDDETNLFTQDLYGTVTNYLGPAHGLAGCVHALRGFVADDVLRGRLATVVETEAMHDDGLVNWSGLAGSWDPEKIRVQWCHGAPGMVATIGDLMPLELALAGGELTWQAGPLAKGSGLCHGTAGNGYAFLRCFALTGDERWLDRARRFAMHAIAQVERERASLGRARFTLWTGDVGVALYLQSCLDGDPRVPTIDVW
jgi:hypothetical protein